MCCAGELFFHLSKKKNFSEDEARFYAAELVCALNHLHTHGVSFEALKPEDILLNAEGTPLPLSPLSSLLSPLLSSPFSHLYLFIIIH
jgi:serine/threonine protein kinase